ncbi:hybrid-cluster NAD(P)-dependent oxidoreductase [Maritimibacter sp. 55A14]|uniref:hybrid-cluster NAD(P)-dependent oxidoreductase n=1 Tax=Maritimibacter sp. 55A14 TaxID=2174844 RepID=UPI000D60C715|nr:hybrid-cluster NAD(P)-dependent oxidoreductase [Maritimibacter sp. 55A14]PWE34073.1 hybrid-cluster NAD(P)-dependent oxidoreductase [Maritimibacter sp. 55A14]
MTIQTQFPQLDEAAAWSDEEALECTMVVPEAPNVFSFTFRASSGAWFRYRAGQFVTLEIPVPGGPVHRTYTISSSPSRPLSLTITAKAQPDSVGTRWMMDNLKPGMRLRAIGPAGIFTLPRTASRKYLFISAGSGITPMMSMTEFLFDLGEAPDICFVTCARRPSELIFRRRLESMARRAPGIRLHLVVGEDDPFDVWTGYRGQLSQLMLGMMAQDYLEREVFCCGPEPFMQAVRDMLIGMGFDMGRYHQESFQAPVESKADAPVHNDVVPQGDAAAELVFAASGVTAPCMETDTVLSVAKSSGLNIPSGCTFGVCGTCKVRKSAGEVHMVHNGGISQADIDAGFILACCSHPIGRVEVEV